MTLNTNLEGLYHFTGNANDSSGNGNNGTVNGATLTTDKNAVSNQAYDFDGTNDSITLVDFDTTAGFTISAWINGDSFATRPKYIVAENNGGADAECSIYVSHTTQFPIFHWVNSGSTEYTAIGTTALSTGTWYHIVGVHDSSANEIKIYVDGVLEATTTVTGVMKDTGRSYYVGRRIYSSFPDWFDGKIDEVRFYSRAITHDEVLQLAKGYDTDADTVSNTQTYRNDLYYSLDDVDLTTGNPNDLSGNGNNGTTTGATTGATGKINEAFDFDGTDDYVEETTYSGNNDGQSVSMWVNFDVVNVQQEVIMSGNGNTWGVRMKDGNDGSVDGRVTCRIGANFSRINSLSAGTWYHIVYTMKSGEMKAYLNGILQDTNSATYTGSGYTGFDIARYFSGTAYLNGKIDEVGVWDRVLTQTEITELYNSGSGLNPYASVPAVINKALVMGSNL